MVVHQLVYTNSKRKIYVVNGHHLYFDGFCQKVIDCISAVFDGYHAAALHSSYYCNGFAAVAAQRKQERIHFFIVCHDIFDDVFYAILRVCQVHTILSLSVYHN